MSRRWGIAFLFILLSVVVVSGLGGNVEARVDAGVTTRVSVSSDGAQGNDGSWDPAISADGRYVAFYSDANNLVTGDTNGSRDIFVRDRQTGETTRVSASSDGTQGNDESRYPAISADGRYVAFESYANNLVDDDTNNWSDIFVHDRQTNETARVSISSAGAQGNSSSEYPALSADGRYVVFYSYSDNLVDDDTNGTWDIFVHDRQTGETTRVSVSSAGTQGNSSSYDPAISADGRYVAFYSLATNLVSGDSNGARDIFVHDRNTGETTRVSVSSTGTQANNYSFSPAISADGRFVAFQSDANNLVADDTNGTWDIFVHDRQMNETTRVSVSSTGVQSNSYSHTPSISADGRYVAFRSWATNLVPDDTNGTFDIFVHDRQTGETTRVSVSSGGTQGNGDSYSIPAISADGRYVTFDSEANNLVTGDTNGKRDVFVHDRNGQIPDLYSISGKITTQGGTPISGVTVSAGSATVTTDASGNYTISGLTAGTYTVVPTLSGYTFTPESKSITVPPTATEVNFVGSPLTYTISGKIKTQVGTPISGVTVSAGSATGTTDASGNYTISGLTAGTYTVAPALSGYTFTPESKSVTVPPTATEVNFVGSPLTYTISGKITTQGGTPISGVAVSAGSATGTTNASGNYTISGLTAGTYKVVPTLSGYTFTPELKSITVPPTATGVNFTATSTLATCDNAAPNVQPLMFITGWGGSEDKTYFYQDDQLEYFPAHLAPHGYVEGCNLFYATGTSPYRTIAENAVVIKENMCAALVKVKDWNQSWNGHFSIIVHSYGGLRARGYLENPVLYGEPCSGGPGNYEFVWVDRLFTLGSPHNGELGDLPFSAIIGLGAVWNREWPAIKEMMPLVRLWQNRQQQQPWGTEYYFIGGDARIQADDHPILQPFLLLPPVMTLANDFAVHERSALGVGLPAERYQQVTRIKTNDLHGQVPSQLDPWGVLKSYVNPADTFNREICGRLGLTGCQTAVVQQSVEIAPIELSSVEEMIADLQEPAAAEPMPLMEIAMGQIAAGESLEGQFEMTGDGPWQVMLNWAGGELDLTLTDPNGRFIDPDEADFDPTIDFGALDTGFGLMAFYTFDETVPGAWSWRVESMDASTVFRLAVVPPVPIAVSVSAPQWSPAGAPIPIQASVQYDRTTPVIGGAVTVTITRPDGQEQTLTLHDDGGHNDGGANDGVFGGAYTPPAGGGHFSLLAAANGTYAGESYQRHATGFFFVAPDNATLTGVYTDRGVDTDGNGLFDSLEVSAQAQIGQAGTYGLVAELYKGTTFIGSAHVEAELTAGSRSLVLMFSAEDIIIAGLDGPYTVRNVMLTDESGITLLIEVADNVHTTHPYKLSQFVSQGHVLLLPVISGAP